MHWCIMPQQTAPFALTIFCFQMPAHRVEATVLLWPRLHDRDKSFWRVLYALAPLEQAAAVIRLGPATVFDAQHCSM